MQLSVAHPNNPFRQPRYVPASEIYTDPAYPMSGSKWLGFGPSTGHVDTQVVHYPGSRLSALQLSTKTEDVKARLKASNKSSWQSRGYALYYNFDLPTDGTLYGIREFNWRNAANADDDKTDGNENDWTFAVHTILQKLYDDNSDTTVEPTWDQLETLRWLRWEAREYGVEASGDPNFQVNLIGHRDIKPTGCPGDKMYAAIQRGDLDIPPRTATPTPPTPPLPIGDDMRYAIFRPFDCAAQFLGPMDEHGNAAFVIWVDKQRADAWIGAGAVVNDDLSLGGFINCVLLGPLPTNDVKHVWTGTEFFRVVQ